MSVSWYMCDCDEVVTISNQSFKELVRELKRSGVSFSKTELNHPYNEGKWDSDFCEQVLDHLINVSDRLIEKNPLWIDTLPVLIEAVRDVASHGGSRYLEII